MATYTEVNFDGLVGPSHNYAALSTGNIASQSHGGNVSNPREAALQGLNKASYLLQRGFRQGIILPHQRPDIGFLRKLGFCGSDSEILEKAHKRDPRLLHLAFSASNMWTANAATVIPSHDSQDGKLHFIVANLYTKAHRAIEAKDTERYLKKIFSADCFRIHSALEGGDAFADEGAANHTRLSASHSDPGLHLFVFGRSAYQPGLPKPVKFEARQTLEACQALARLGQVESRSIFVQQSPEAIDAGVFHNDVISVGNENLLFLHEKAFTSKSYNELQSFLKERLSSHHWIEVKEKHVPLVNCVSSYLFNSQLLSLPDGETQLLLCPIECQEDPIVKAYLDELVASHPKLKEWVALDLRQSMKNGGGPACLRLRVQMSEQELQSMHSGALLNEERIEALRKVVQTHYRDRLSERDFLDPQLLLEIERALEAFAQTLNIGSYYAFQR